MVKTFRIDILRVITYTFPAAQVVGVVILSVTSTILQFCGISSSRMSSFSQETITMAIAAKNINLRYFFIVLIIFVEC